MQKKYRDSEKKQWKKMDSEYSNIADSNIDWKKWKKVLDKIDSGKKHRDSGKK